MGLKDILQLAPPQPQGADFYYGLVTSTNPLRVRLDGEQIPVAAKPASLDRLETGSRVLTMIYKRRMIVLGVVGGGPYQVLPGTIVMYGGLNDPSGWIRCDGRALSRAAYPDLFAVIGTTWGPGNGNTTFNLPNYNDRAPVGQGAANPTVGAAMGEAQVALTVAQMPSHTHVQNAHQHALGDGNAHSFAWGVNKGTVSVPNANATGGGSPSGNPLYTFQDDWNAVRPVTAVNQHTGGNAAHNNVPPSRVSLFIIKH